MGDFPRYVAFDWIARQDDFRTAQIEQAGQKHPWVVIMEISKAVNGLWGLFDFLKEWYGILSAVQQADLHHLSGFGCPDKIWVESLADTLQVDKHIQFGL